MKKIITQKEYLILEDDKGFCYFYFPLIDQSLDLVSLVVNEGIKYWRFGLFEYHYLFNHDELNPKAEFHRIVKQILNSKLPSIDLDLHLGSKSSTKIPDGFLPIVIEQDILKIQRGIIAHQVNCKGVMGAGLAREIRKKYPVVYDTYREQKDQLELGLVVPVQISEELYVLNLCGQDEFGRGKIYTDYSALAQCLQYLQEKSTELNLLPYLPYQIGCGLAGGNWEIVKDLIKEYCPNAIICKYKNM